MKPLTSLFLLSFALFAISCDKDARPNEGTELLKTRSSFKGLPDSYRIYVRNTSNKVTAFRDSSTSVTVSNSLEYGTNGKASRINYLNSLGTILHYFQFEYNPDGTIRKRQFGAGTLDIGDDYNIYTYDASGHLLIDSQFTRGSTPTYKLVRVAKFTYTGNNVTEAESYLVISGNMTLQNRVKYEYDNGLNPYKNLGDLYQYNESGSATGDIRYFSQNNVVKEYVATGNAPYELSQEYIYQYNSSNYPWKSRPGKIIPGQSNVEYEYFYQQ